MINPDQVIATIDAPDGVLDMDIWITQDRGYKPAELQESYSIGEIPIDAIYTPIERVNFVVEHTRVGPMTDYDRLIIEVLTDGTIEPDDALAEAARILVRQAQVFAVLDQRDAAEAAGPGLVIPDEILEQAACRAWPFAASAQRPAQPPNRARRSGPDRRSRTTPIHSQFWSALAELSCGRSWRSSAICLEGEVGIASPEYLDGIDLDDEGLDEVEGEVRSATDDEMAEAIAALRGDRCFRRHGGRGGYGMRHRKSGRKFGRNPAQRRAMMRQLAISMIMQRADHHDGGEGQVASPGRREAGDIAREDYRAPPQPDHVEDRQQGGDVQALRGHRLRGSKSLQAGTREYSKLGQRHGDAAPLALIEFVEA